LLPFLHKKLIGGGGLIVERIKADKPNEDSPEEDSNEEAIRACARDLIEAIHSRDEKGVTDAIKSAFEILDSMPHDEGEHIEE
jgi:hypothetical protein